MTQSTAKLEISMVYIYNANHRAGNL